MSVTITDPGMPGYACGCYIGPWLGINPPPMCPTHGTQWVPSTTTTTTLKWPPETRLTDDEIERIAKRVAELLRNVTSSDGA